MRKGENNIKNCVEGKRSSCSELESSAPGYGTISGSLESDIDPLAFIKKRGNLLAILATVGCLKNHDPCRA